VELREALRRRKSVRSFREDAVPREVLDHVMASTLHAPSAGFTQGNEWLLLDDPDVVAWFWRTTDDPTDARPEKGEATPAPVVATPLVNRQAYLDRYSAPDKEQYGLGEEERWPVPFWHVDAGMASMCVLLAAVDEGLGAWFFGMSHGQDEVLARFGVPPQFQPAGAIALGYPADVDPLSAGSSARTRRRRPADELVHRNGW